MKNTVEQTEHENYIRLEHIAPELVSGKSDQVEYTMDAPPGTLIIERLYGKQICLLWQEACVDCYMECELDTTHRTLAAKTYQKGEKEYIWDEGLMGEECQKQLDSLVFAQLEEALKRNCQRISLRKEPDPKENNDRMVQAHANRKSELVL